MSESLPSVMRGPADVSACGAGVSPVQAGGTPAPLSARERLGALILFATVGVLLFGALGAKQLWKSEARWAEVTREMMLTGDYFHPTINGVDYYDKPLLGYWLVALVAKLTGRLTEWTVRLPSVLAGLAALWAVFALGWRLWSAKVALTAGWMLLTSYGFLFYARLGLADMENMAAIVLAIAWYWRCRERPGLLGYIVFYLICALGAQTKGLAAIIVPMVAILPDLARAGRWRRQITLAHAAGLAIGAAAYLSPFLLSPGGLALVYRENFQRAVDPFDHQEPWFAYFYHVPILFLPWSPALVFVGIWVVRRWKQVEAHTRWLALAMLLIFLFFTASGSRRSYYILPILPLAALLCSVSLWAPGFVPEKRVLVRIMTGVAAAVGVVWMLSFVSVPILRWWQGLTLPGEFVLATPVIGLAALAPILLARRARQWLRSLAVYPGLPPVMVSAAVLLAGFFCVQYPVLDVYGGERSFADTLLDRLGVSPDAVPMAVYGDAPASFFFYMNRPRPLQRVLTRRALAEFLNSGRGPHVVIAHERSLSRLRNLGFPAGKIERPDVKERVLPWDADDDDEKLCAFIIDPAAQTRAEGEGDVH